MTVPDEVHNSPRGTLLLDFEESSAPVEDSRSDPVLQGIWATNEGTLNKLGAPKRKVDLITTPPRSTSQKKNRSEVTRQLISPLPSFSS